MTLRIAAQYADLWNGFGPLDAFTRGRTASSTSGARRSGATRPRSSARCGSIAPEFGRLDDYVAAGATHFICGGPAPFDFADLKRLIAWRDARAS